MASDAEMGAVSHGAFGDQGKDALCPLCWWAASLSTHTAHHARCPGRCCQMPLGEQDPSSTLETGRDWSLATKPR